MKEKHLKLEVGRSFGPLICFSAALNVTSTISPNRAFIMAPCLFLTAGQLGFACCLWRFSTGFWGTAKRLLLVY